jgi:hypothetical protein
VAEYLDAVHHLNGARNRDLLDGLVEPLRALNAGGINPVLMKGSASLVTDLYPDRGMRIIGDVDLLVEGGDALRASEILGACGFEPVENGHDFRDHHHLTPQRHPVTGLIIEVHHEPIDRKWGALLDGRSVRAEARVGELAGRPVLVPSPTHRVIQNVVHSQLSHANYEGQRLDLRQLLELAALARFYSAAIDWAQVRGVFAANRQLQSGSYGSTGATPGQSRPARSAPCTPAS